tara:strand:+ start:296 stop:607 length:312 start_codon:yes stop_codon:yes gene_type:complete
LISLVPNTYIKLSEFGVEGQDWNYAENANIIYELIDFFSPDRCMFESNFPLSKFTFNNLFNNYKKIVEKFSIDEKKLFFQKQLLKHIISSASFLISNEFSKRI